MNRHRFQTTTSLVLGTAVLIVIALIVLHRVPMSDTVHAQDSWRGLVVAPEQRCAPYDTDDYRYRLSDRENLTPVHEFSVRCGDSEGVQRPSWLRRRDLCGAGWSRAVVSAGDCDSDREQEGKRDSYVQWSSLLLR